jgi:hypothetical protein
MNELLERLHEMSPNWMLLYMQMLVYHQRTKIENKNPETFNINLVASTATNDDSVVRLYGNPHRTINHHVHIFLRLILILKSIYFQWKCNHLEFRLYN